MSRLENTMEFFSRNKCTQPKNKEVDSNNQVNMNQLALFDFGLLVLLGMGFFLLFTEVDFNMNIDFIGKAEFKTSQCDGILEKKETKEMKTMRISCK